jgi:hypothetical protein
MVCADIDRVNNKRDKIVNHLEKVKMHTDSRYPGNLGFKTSFVSAGMVRDIPLLLIAPKP